MQVIEKKCKIVKSFVKKLYNVNAPSTEYITKAAKGNILSL